MALSEAGWFDRAANRNPCQRRERGGVAKAREGYYRSAPSGRCDPLREKYFLKEQDGWRPVPALSQRIASWSVVNLMSSETCWPMPARRRFSVATPSSTSRQAMRRVVDAFADLMPPRGFCSSARPSRS
jgi:hypothetical protein